MLLAAADSWSATEWLNDQYLGELVLLGERACRPLSAKKVDYYLVYEHPLNLWVERDLDDLEYLHDIGSRQWLDWIDQSDPLHYVRGHRGEGFGIAFRLARIHRRGVAMCKRRR